MAFGHVTGQPHDHAARVRLPVGSEQTGERRDEIAAAVVIDAARQNLDLRRAVDQSQIVAQPLYQRAGDGDRPLERVYSRLRANLIANRGQQAILRLHRLLPGIDQQKASRAVGVLAFPRREARLSEQRGLLVAERRGHRDALQNSLRLPVDLRR